MTQRVELPTAYPPEISGEPERARWCCEQLEEGNILFFPEPPFEIPAEDMQFLLTQEQSGARHHKNIAYRPAEDRLTGYSAERAEQVERLRGVMREYSQRVVRFTAGLLAPYAERWRLDFASFRPQEERGRQNRLRARNDLLHVDSFPTRPSNGDRILRVFTNINPREPREWVTGETLAGLAEPFGGDSGLPLPKRLSASHRAALRLARAAGLGDHFRPPYDRWMLRFHHYLKAHEEFQRTSPRSHWAFPPLSTWLAFTDLVSHAVLAGQFALEQTFIVERQAMLLPEKAPVGVLERLAGEPLTLC